MRNLSSNFLMNVGMSNISLDIIKNNFIYSSEEKQIGIYFDKPLYRKSFKFTSLISNINVSNIDDLVKCECVLRQNDGWRNIPWLFDNAGSYGPSSWAGGFYIRSNGVIGWQIGSDLSAITKGTLTIEYTKL